MHSRQEMTRVEALVLEQRNAVSRRVDRFFAVLMVGQWFAGITIAASRDPGMSPHMFAAVFLGGAISCAPVALAILRPGLSITPYVNAVAQMLWSGLLIQLMGGRVETHFHVFGSLTFLSFYRHWRVLVLATVVITSELLLRGVFWPDSATNPEWSRLLEHSAWIVFIDVFLVTACVWDARESVEIATRRAETETLADQLRERIRERTHQLADTREQLVASERLSTVGTLAAGVAHEINNPLAFILGNVDFAVRELRSPVPELPEVIAALEEAKVGGTRVRDIVRDLKLFARAPAVEKGSTAVEPLLERSIAMAANEIRHRAKLVRAYGGVPFANGAETRLGQVFLNLLINAAQSIPEGNAEANEIRVSTRMVGDRIVVEVADTGCGMSAEVREHVFEPFFTTKPIGVGTGLGLSICHGIIRSLGGAITVESEPGKGTCFRVSLQPAGVATPDAPVAAAVGHIDSRDILVIDDEPLLARSLRRGLAPHRVIAETSGRSALTRLAAGERFDLVVCDVMMPEMSGPEVFEEMCRVAPEQAERVIFLTGGAFTASARDFLAASHQPVLEKPADADDIRRILGSMPALKVAARRRPTLTSLSGERPSGP